MKKTPGFTFVELIVASAIVTLVVLAAYSAFHGGLISYRRIESSAQDSQQATIVFSRIESDLKNAFVFKADDSGFKGSLSSMQFWGVVASYNLDRRQTDLCRLRYESQSAGLRRTLFRGLYSMMPETQDGSVQGTYAVRDAQFHYAAASDNPQQPFTWLDSWPREGDEKTAKSLPLAVKVEFAAGSAAVRFSRTIALPGLVSAQPAGDE